MENLELGITVFFITVFSLLGGGPVGIIEHDVQPIEIEVNVVGDIMMHGSQLRSGRSENDYNFDSFFEYIRPIIETGDLSIANLETTLLGKGEYSGYPRFNSPDSIVDSLKYAGFDTLITSNNHSLDTGIAGLTRTYKIVSEKGLTPIGTKSSETNLNYSIKDIKGLKIAIVSYTEHANGLENNYSNAELNNSINLISEENIKRNLLDIRAHNPDLIMAYMHWGSEYKKKPNNFQKKYAELLTKEGVDLIIGSHPHVIQSTDTLEIDGNTSHVFYSLGNFISNQRVETLGEDYKPTEDGVILKLKIEKNNDGTLVKGIDFIPTWVHRYKDTGPNYEFRILPIKQYLKEHEVDQLLYERMMNSHDETLSRLKGGL